MSYKKRAFTFVVALAAVALTACGREQPTAAVDMPPPQVGVVTVEPEPITLVTELPGRLEAVRTAQVRARVAGIVLEQTFREGSEVKAGDVLFRIDPAPLQAALNSAKAQLARAEANFKQASSRAQRFAPLVKTNAISQQDYDDAVAARDQAAAEVVAAKAAVETARLNLGYATVTAPIDGRIGRALVTEGALVGQGEATPLAIIQQIDPLYVNLVQSSAELLRLRRALASGQLEELSPDEVKITLITEDGEEYPHPGRLLFSDISVDPTTGAVMLRAVVPNPDRFLLPGMYVRARLEQAVASNAITVPQQAVSRTGQGDTVMVVDDEGRVAVRPVQVGRAYVNRWVINAGLQPGDRVIVDGLQKIRPGIPVTPVAWRDPLQPAEPSAVGGTAAGPYPAVATSSDPATQPQAN